MSWLSNSIEYMNTHQKGSRNWGNHGICVDHDKVYFSYFSTDIVIADDSAKTLTINDAGYSRGTTPRAISQILNIYDKKDYDVINNCASHYDMWYNARKYRITIFDYDINNCQYTMSEREAPIYRTVETVPDNMTPRQFRDNYFEKTGLSLLDKNTKQVWCKNLWYSGMCYTFCDKIYRYCGTMMFEPLNIRLAKRTYLRRV